MASLLDEAKTFVPGLTAIPGRQACFLDVPGTDSAAQLSVVSFTATEEMGEPNTLRIVLTHPLQLPRADYLNRDAAFRVVPDDGQQRKFSGYIERFSTIQTTKDFVKYEVVLKSHLGRLAAVTNSQIYQHQSTPEILEALMGRHALRPEQYAFRLRRKYPTHLFRFQYRMTDLAYAQMLMQRSGIYCYTVETEYGDQIVLASQQNMTISSSEGHVVMQAGKSLTLTDGGGAYLKLENGHVTIGSPAQVTIKMANFQWDGPDSIQGKLPGFQACHASNAAASTSGENSGALA